MTTGLAVAPALSARDDRRFFGHPMGLATLFATELWERFSYYGMVAILVLYLAADKSDGGMGLPGTTAIAIFGVYGAVSGLLTVPGAWIADRVLGPHRSVLIGACTIAAGHYVLAIPAPASLWPGIALVAIGTGLLKPSISAMVGDTMDDTVIDGGDATIQGPGPVGDFGRYELLSLLGSGGMGQVWRARDSQTNRVVALKVLPEHSADGEEPRERFRRECQAVAQLTEPHVDSDPRLRRHRRSALSEYAASRRHGPAHVDQTRGGPAAAASGGDHRSGGRRTAGGSRRRAGAPRRQALQHPGLCQRFRLPDRLRDRPCVRRPHADQGRRNHRHRGVHGSGGHRRRRQNSFPGRRVCDGLCALRVSDRPATVYQRLGRAGFDRTSST
jgi:hypothetical protein